MPFSWSKSSDGTYTIWSVDIFSEHPVGQRDYAITEQDIDYCIKKLQERQNKGYLAPVHDEHFNIFSDTDEKHRIGFICNPTKTRNNEYNSTVTADIIGIQAEDFEKIQSGKWPYRSVEGYFNPEDPSQSEIWSLAFMESAPPFFKYKLLVLNSQAETNMGMTVYEVLEQSEQQDLVMAADFSEGKDKRYIYSKGRFYMNPEDDKKEEMQDEVVVEEPTEDEVEEEVPGWAQDIMTKLGEIMDILKPEEEEVAPEAPSTEEFQLSQARAIAGLMTQGYSEAIACKLAKAGVTTKDLTDGIKVDTTRPRKASVKAPKEDDFDYTELKDRGAFMGLSKDEYLAKMQTYGHIYFPDRFEKLDGKVVRRAE